MSPHMPPAVLEHRRKLFTRTNAHLFVRHDAWRFAPPGTPRYVGKDVARYCEVEPNVGEAGESERKEYSPGDPADLSADIEALRRDLRELAAIGVQLKRLRLLRALKGGFNPDQPRVPAGSRDGGQWTSGGGPDGSLVAYVDVDGEPETLLSNPFDADIHLVGSRITIDYSEALTGLPRIDETTKALIKTLGGVVASLPDGSGPVYGTLVHKFFGLAVRAQGLDGIGFSDVETTFSLRDGARYGAEGSIRTDVVLRDEADEIIAIYDVKTGISGISEERAAELRLKTGTGPEVPIIKSRQIGVFCSARRVYSIVNGGASWQ
jgi:hypothetical protein